MKKTHRTPEQIIEILRERDHVNARCSPAPS